MSQNNRVQTAIIDVTDWPRDEEFSVFPIGSKPKKLLICPANPQNTFLIPGHNYLFKTTTERFHQQVWSEVIAYRLGSLWGLSVPPCFIAIDRKFEQTGALVEFFYGYPGEKWRPRFVPASDFMTRILVDKKRGRPHRLLINLLLSRRLCGVEAAKEWWAKALAFDSLIGNVDRHPDNWGFLFHVRAHDRETALAPLFDNGTSLGYEIAESKLVTAIEPARVQRYINRGKHHCGWAKDGPFGHFDLCREFLNANPDAVRTMGSTLEFEMSEVRSLLDRCVDYDTGIKFSKERADLVFSLIRARRSALASLLEG